VGKKCAKAAAATKALRCGPHGSLKCPGQGRAGSSSSFLPRTLATFAVAKAHHKNVNEVRKSHLHLLTHQFCFEVWLREKLRKNI